MAIISASRRTDIPAWYSAWFMDKINRGFCEVSNPFNGRVERIPLGVKDVDGIVFWSRDYRPMMDHLPRLLDMGYRFYFQFTIIGYPEYIDPGSPSTAIAAETAHELCKKFGPRCVVWRYDPVMLTSHTGVGWHLDNFRELCGRLRGAADTCIISFIDYYKKLDRNLFPALKESGVAFSKPGWEELRGLAQELAHIAGGHGLRVTACCEPELKLETVAPASCVDRERLGAIAGAGFSDVKTNPTRKGCRCAASKDIGAYDTCPSGCAYCYANNSRELSAKRMRAISETGLALKAAGANKAVRID